MTIDLACSAFGTPESAATCIGEIWCRAFAPRNCPSMPPSLQSRTALHVAHSATQVGIALSSLGMGCTHELYIGATCCFPS